MSFLSIEFFYLLVIPFIYFFFYKRKKEDLIYIVIFILLVTALARPIIIKEKVEDESQVEFIVALDISKSMLAKDVLPNRFEFTKQKTLALLQQLSSQKVALIAYSNQPYLISPFTNNYETLKFFIENLSLENINQNGSDLMKLLQGSDAIFTSQTNRAILIITDGTDQKSFEKEIAYAKQQNISLFIYIVATTKGTVIEYKERLIKDSENQIVIFKKNNKIEELALKTNGEYLEYSLEKNDLKPIIKSITDQYQYNLIKENTENKLELFYYLLGLAFILYLTVRFDILRGIK